MPSRRQSSATEISARMLSQQDSDLLFGGKHHFCAQPGYVVPSDPPPATISCGRRPRSSRSPSLRSLEAGKRPPMKGKESAKSKKSVFYREELATRSECLIHPGCDVTLLFLCSYYPSSWVGMVFPPVQR